jgi:hypothetical protein
MKLSALLLTFVIGLGLTTPLEAKKHKTPKPPHHSTTHKAPKRGTKMPKVKKKPTKMKPMKFPKAKHSASVKPAKVRKSKAPKSV